MIERSAGAIIFRKDRGIKYLVLQYGQGHWDFVKGNIEKKEDSHKTTIREAKEETGIHDLEFIDKFKQTEHYFYKRNGKFISKYVVYFLAQTKTKRIRLSYEHKDFRWLNYKDAMKLVTFMNAREILRKANNFLKKIK